MKALAQQAMRNEADMKLNSAASEEAKLKACPLGLGLGLGLGLASEETNLEACLLSSAAPWDARWRRQLWEL